MRKVLFRGKRKDNGEWVEGDLFNNYDERKFVGELVVDDYTGFACDQYEVGIGFAEVIPETVGEFTGVVDANGKKVFEGDIVKLTEDVKKTFGATDGVVKFNHGAFFVNGKNGILDSLFVLVDYTYILRGWVIGNIYDNPELIQEVK